MQYLQELWLEQVLLEPDAGSGGGDLKKPSGRRCDADLDEKCLDRLGVCVYNELNFTEAMIEKQTVQFFRELPDGARQQAGRAFRSGAANDEFDGSARYSGQSWPYGKLGGNAGFRLPSLDWDGSFLFSSRRQIGWYREKGEARPKRELLLLCLFSLAVRSDLFGKSVQF
jgi:hypothetical protein